MAIGKKGAEQQITAAERRVKALALRKAGASYRAIGEHLGVSYQTAFDDIAYGLKGLAAELHTETAELRALEAARLDALQAACWPQAMRGDDKALRTAVRILERRARLLGLDLQPGLELPGDLEITLRWHDDNRRIIDISPAADDHAAAPPQLAAYDRAAPSALSYRVRWQTLGQEPTSGDAESQDGA